MVNKQVKRCLSLGDCKLNNVVRDHCPPQGRQILTSKAQTSSPGLLWVCFAGGIGRGMALLLSLWVLSSKIKVNTITHLSQQSYIEAFMLMDTNSERFYTSECLATWWNRFHQRSCGPLVNRGQGCWVPSYNTHGCLQDNYPVWNTSDADVRKFCLGKLKKCSQN